MSELTDFAGRHLTVVAHPDDDLLFVNPDIQQAIAAGVPCTTVVLTASEYNGVPGQRTREQYAADEQQGQRSAYAQFAGVANSWNRQAVTVAGHQVEVAVLAAAPQIALVYLSLPDGLDDDYDHALQNLWYGPADFSTPTLVPTGGPVTQVQTYTRGDLLAVLTALYQRFTPTTIRMQDPAADPRYRNEHEDHDAGAHFARQAARAYGGPSAGRYAVLTHYRCYNTQDFAADVPAPWLASKTAGYRLYQQFDPLTTADLDDNLARVYSRWPVAAPWAALDGAGALHAFAVLSGRLLHWSQPAGGAWHGPVDLGGGNDLLPTVSVARSRAGRLRVAVTGWGTHTVRSVEQTAPGGGFGAWQDLGNPGSVGPDDPFTGGPAVLGNPDDGFEVLVRDPVAGGLVDSYQTGPGSAFQSWTSIGGDNEVQDPPVGLASRDLWIEAYADDHGGTARWASTVLDGAVDVDSGFPRPAFVGPPVAVLTAAGVRYVVGRATPNGTIGVLSRSGSSWSGPVDLGSAGTGSPAAVVSPDGRLVVFAGTGQRGVGVCRQTAPGGGFGSWQDLGGFAEVGPAAVVDSAGAIRLLVVGGDGQLHERRQAGAGADYAFGAWSVAAG